MQHEEPIIAMRAVVKGYDGKMVLPGVDLAVRDGEFLTILGPSGCGKTTILRLLAGFEAPDSGEIRIDGRRVNPLPPHKRAVNTVFQSYALFPHMTVYHNVAFGLRMKRVHPRELHDRVAEALAMVKLSEFADRKPHQLSGGQQQRVALARAVVNRPRVLLLDECLNALDHKLRRQMQMELKALQRRLGITFIFVTHDQEEALSMSDRLVVMREGHIEQTGTPREVYENPVSLYVARFVGEVNVFSGRILRRLDEATVMAEIEGIPHKLQARPPLGPGAAIKVLLRPEDMRIQEIRNGGRKNGRFAGRVVERTYKGMTLDSVIAIENGPRIIASEFFDEDDPSFDYAIDTRVSVGWVPGWEVVLPDD